MKNIIEKIRKIKGVVTVEPAGENMAVVVFERRHPEWMGRQYVKCTTESEYEFVQIQNNLKGYSAFRDWAKYPCVCVNGTDIFSLEAFPERSYRVIDFVDYLTIFLLTGKWVAFQKPKSLSPEELVDGEIYVDEDVDYPNIFRFKTPKYGTIKFASYSRLFQSSGHFESEMMSIMPKGIHAATVSEKQTLIRAEIANGYFHNLK